MQRADGCHLRFAEALISTRPMDAEQFCGIEARLAADRIFHHGVGDAVQRNRRPRARRHARVDLGWANPPSPCREARRAERVQPTQVDHGNAVRKMPSKSQGTVAPWSGLAPALRTADEIQLLGPGA